MFGSSDFFFLMVFAALSRMFSCDYNSLFLGAIEGKKNFFGSPCVMRRCGSKSSS